MSLQLLAYENIKDSIGFEEYNSYAGILSTCIFSFFFEFQLISVLTKLQSFHMVLPKLHLLSVMNIFQLKLSRNTKAVLLLVDNEIALYQSLVEISNMTVRPRLFAIYFNQQNRNDSIDLWDYFTECINLDIFFSAFIEIQEFQMLSDERKNNSTSFNLNIFNPFQINNSGKRGFVHSHEIHDDASARKESKKLLHHYDHYMKNFHGLKLMVRSYHDVLSVHMRWKGIDQMFLETLIAFVNCTIAFEYRDVPFDAFYHGTGKVKNKMIDILLNRYYMTGNYGEVAIVSPLNFDELCFITGEEPRVYQGENLKKVFRPTVWFMIFTTTVIVIMLTRLMSLMIGGPLRTIHIVQSLVSTGNVHVKMLHQRIFWLSWMLFSFIIACSFSSFIVTMMTIPKYGQKLLTLDDILKSGRMIYLYESYSNSVWTNTSPILQEVVERSIPNCDNVIKQFWNSLKFRDSVIATGALKRKFYEFTLHKEGLMFYTIPECMGSFFTGYIMRKKSILFYPMRRIINSFKEFGFYEKWYDMAEHIARLNPIHPEETHKSVASALGTLIVGQGMSLIEGIGDEVLHFCILLLVFTMGAIAWWSTNIAESPLLTTVLILERRTRTRHANQRNESVTSRQVTATAVAITEANSGTGTRNGIDTGQNGGGEAEERVGETQEVVVSGGGVEEQDEDDKQEESNGQRTLVVETDVEPAPGDIFEIVEEGNAADGEPAAENSSMLRRRRLAFFMNRGATLIEPATPTPTEAAAAPSVEAVGGAAADEQMEEPESSADCIRIRLKYLNDNQTVVEGRLQEQLGDFKRRHFSLELAAEKMVRLIFNGQVLQSDSQTLQGYGLFDNCVVHCLVHNQRTNQSSRTASSHSSHQPTHNSGSSRNNGTAPPEWNLGTVLYASLSICLGFALYCRYQYSHLFTVTTSAALFGLSAIFAVTLVGQFLPDSETIQ
ncbi:hypothetical protein LSTR_LSTR011397 [Laodelphax striatellus]|uniref:Ubiquitin-like domain-containing protein n=1 Tax=Laodelphax striatellus TaxID=195883 RepID=A0A482XSE2_LAOST|nr:hypothetical protein LSTR_LSTR011397 [Laodelphax striatellus]